MKIRCIKCNDIIESKSIHNCISCKCGACSIDGGDKYTRIGGDLNYIVIIKDDGTEVSATSIKPQVNALDRFK